MATPPEGRASAASDALLTTVNGAPSKRRGQLALAVCGPCRRSKLKCGCERPVCQRCVRAGRPCFYDTQPGETRGQATKRKLTDTREESHLYEELFDYLRTLDPYRANDVYQRIRYGFDLHILLTQIRAGDLIRQLNLQPEVQFRYELPYSKQLPRELLADNPYLDTVIYETASLGLQDRPMAERVVSAPRAVYHRPFHAAIFVDHLIEDARPSLWTTVCQDDGIMRRLLRNLFLCEFNFMSAFQKDYFLEDMISRQGDFCSSLLVNAVMAYACVCDPHIPNRAEYWNPSSLTYKFLMEAKRLWELEASIAHISTVQAGIVLNGISNLSGLDEIGHAYRTHTIALANQMGLYDGLRKTGGARLRQGEIYTAWALLCWDALLAFELRQAPLLPRPPADSLPSSEDNAGWYGSFWLQYPGHQESVNAHFGAFFEHRAQLRIIMAQYCNAAFREPEASHVPVDDAYDYRSRLLAWFDSLPASLWSGNIALPAQLQLHMYYHQFMITIFEPHLEAGTTHEPHPPAIIHEANRCFATLFRLYYIRHGHSNMDIHIIISLIYAGIRCLNAMHQQQEAAETADLEGLRATLILCATGLYQQRRNNYLAHALYSALRNMMRAEELALIRQVPDLRDDAEALMLRQATRSKWIPTVMKIRGDRGIGAVAAGGV